MKIDIITIFPDLFTSFLQTSIIKKAITAGKVSFQVHNLRDYSDLPHQQVDDTPYGGGAGMIMAYPPFHKILSQIKQPDSLVIILTPQGQTYKQAVAKSLVTHNHIIIICGRYEGYDERVFDHCDIELSLGDFITMGGELPAMVICESLVRLIPGVIDYQSVVSDTFENQLLKYPQYTKPFSYNGKTVPEILISGHHQHIDQWRLEQAIAKTKQRRPDLYKKYKAGLK